MPTKYKLEFEINALPKTLNTSLRMHWASRNTENKKWDRWVNAFAMKQGKPKAPLQKAILKLTRHSSTAPDPDGLIGSFKCVLDALVSCGVLQDDTFLNVGIPEYRWEKSKRGYGKITVSLEEV